MTPLSLAAIEGQEGVVRVLLEGGADKEARDVVGEGGGASDDGMENMRMINHIFIYRTPLTHALSNSA